MPCGCIPVYFPPYAAGPTSLYGYGATPTVGCVRPVQRMRGYDPNAAPPAWTPGMKPWTAASQPGSLLKQPPAWAQAQYAQFFGAGQGPTTINQ